MRFPGWMAAVVAALVLLMGSVFVVSEGHTAIVLNLGRVVAHRPRPRPALQVAAGGNRARVRPPPAGAAGRAGALPDLRAQGRQRRLLRGRADPGRARVLPRHRRRRERRRCDRLAPIIKDALRNEINARTLQQVVSGDRTEIVKSQLDVINKGAATLGVRIIDLRIKQHRPAHRQPRHRRRLQPHARTAPAGGQPPARRGRGAGQRRSAPAPTATSR